MSRGVCSGRLSAKGSDWIENIKGGELTDRVETHHCIIFGCEKSNGRFCFFWELKFDVCRLYETKTFKEKLEGLCTAFEDQLSCGRGPKRALSSIASWGPLVWPGLGPTRPSPALCCSAERKSSAIHWPSWKLSAASQLASHPADHVRQLAC